MAISVKEISDVLNQYAPNDLSYQWDNTGLLIGENSQQVNRILLSLDVTDQIIQYAVDNNFDMIISHHPFIFKAIKKINHPAIIKLIKNSIAVFTAHTNLDLVKNGVNFALAKRLELKNQQFIQKSIDKEFFHISVFVPGDAVEKVKKAAFNAGGGFYGNYQKCAAQYPVSGQFMPFDQANPVFGELNHLEYVEEVKLEFFADSIKLKTIISAILSNHPYEMPVYVVNKLNQDSPNYGLGLTGDLEESMSLIELAEFVKEKLNAPFVKLWTAGHDEEKRVKRLAVCGGSGSSLLGLVSSSDCFVSGDFTYHQMLDSSTPLIDAGHYYTEVPVLDNLQEVLSILPVYTEKVKTLDHDIQKLKLI
ncbi:MAG TPA: Nif3-like dinuclear metal center hexameric protein [Candidatus Cloacimonadota bacterium]|nr:Nif3-like dinuclear metal center hexameric protein [Candidatus Cloacimonadota bacterium]